LLGLTASAALWTRELLEQLQVDPERMRANLAVSPAAGAPLPDGAQELTERALAAHRTTSDSEVGA
jgi:hypothetical protein